MDINIIKDELNNKFLSNIDNMKVKKSLLYGVADMVPIEAPTYLLQTLFYKNNELDFKQKEINVGDESNTLEISFDYITIEKIVDIKKYSKYKDVIEKIFNLYQTQLAYMQDNKLMELLKNSSNIETLVNISEEDFFNKGIKFIYNASKELAKLPLSDIRSQRGFIVVNTEIASILGSLKMLKDEDRYVNFNNYIGTFNNLDIFVNFDNNFNSKKEFYIGILGDSVTKGSVIYLPYKQFFITTLNNNAETKLILKNRSIITTNPYHDNGKDMLVKGTYVL